MQGNYNGLSVLEKKAGKWQFRNRLKGYSISSRFFEFKNEKELFVNHEYNGVINVRVDKGYTQVLNYEMDKNELAEQLKYSSSDCLLIVTCVNRQQKVD